MPNTSGPLTCRTRPSKSGSSQDIGVNGKGNAAGQLPAPCRGGADRVLWLDRSAGELRTLAAILFHRGTTEEADESVSLKEVKVIRTKKITLLSVWILFGFLLAARPVFGVAGLTVEEVMKDRAASQVQVSADGSKIVFVVSSPDYKLDVYRRNIFLSDAASGQTLQLTNGPRSDFYPRWSPDGKQIAFLSERSEGTEAEGKKPKTQIWVISVGGGEAQKLTDAEEGVSAFEWSPDGKSVAYLSADRPTEDEKKREKRKDDWIEVDKAFRFARLYVIAAGGGKPRQLGKEDAHVTRLSWSPDGSAIAYSVQPTPKVHDGFHSKIRAIKVADETTRDLATWDGANTDPRWSPDGKTVAFLSTRGQVDWIANRYLTVVPAAGGEPKIVSKAFDEEVNDFRWLPDSRTILFSGDAKTQAHLFSLSVEGGAVQQISAGEFVYSSFDVARDGRSVAAVRAALATPPTVILSTDTGKNFREVSKVQQPFEVAEMSSMSVIRWPSTDGFTIEGILVKPARYEEGRRYPLLVIVHGGPAGVFSQGFTARRYVYPAQAFATEGYVVLLPNPRGSGGYGEAFRRANFQDWGGGDYRDIMAGVDYLIEKGMADADRMGVMGWSYGGYMTSWIITQTKRFRAASPGAAVTNLYSFFGTADIPPFLPQYFGGFPWEQQSAYLKHSPMFNVKGVSTPTLILHGMSDVRVPLSQGEELYEALKAQNVPVQMVKYPRQGHGFNEPRFQRDCAYRLMNWFNEHVRGQKTKLEPPAEEEKAE